MRSEGGEAAVFPEVMKDEARRFDFGNDGISVYGWKSATAEWYSRDRTRQSLITVQEDAPSCEHRPLMSGSVSSSL